MKKQKVSPTGRVRNTKIMGTPYASFIWYYVDTNLDTSLAFSFYSSAPLKQILSKLTSFTSLHPSIYICDNLHFVSRSSFSPPPLISPSLPFRRAPPSAPHCLPKLWQRRITRPPHNDPSRITQYA